MDKLVEEILNKINDNHFYYSRDEVIKAMKSYHEAKLKEELIKYRKYLLGKRESEELLVDEYLKQRKNDTNS